MSARITLPGSLEQRLRMWLNGHPQNHERGAFVLFRKFDRPVQGLPASPRYVAVDIIEIGEEWVIGSSRSHFRFNMRILPPLYFRCEQEGLELGFAHSHPVGVDTFSSKDNSNEQNILRGYAGCNGLAVTLVALILVSDQWRARVRSATSPGQTSAARHVAILSDRMDIQQIGGDRAPSDILLRQEAAFGKPFNQKLQSLRVAVIGAGGTGSPLATMLARSGVGELIIIDGDDVEETNLNRVRGYRKADIGNNKAERLTSFINELDVGCIATDIPEYVDRSPQAIDAISGADIVFGCTDDVAGRDVLTQAMYYYCLGYLDLGLTGSIDTDDGTPYLRDHRGRVSRVLPEFGSCLRCQRVVTEAKLAYERALRERPELANLDPETLRREYYLTGGHESSPGIGPFTGAIADMAVASFMDLIRPFRRLTSDFRDDNLWYDFIHLTIYSNMPEQDDSCFCCGTNGLLNASERGYRLGMPALGKLPS